MASNYRRQYLAVSPRGAVYGVPTVLIRVLLHGDVWFELDGIEELAAAFELALSELELSDRQDPLAVVVAKFIIELAKEGERDPDKLCQGALSILRQRRG